MDDSTQLDDSIQLDDSVQFSGVTDGTGDSAPLLRTQLLRSAADWSNLI